MTNDNNAGYIKTKQEHQFNNPVFLYEAKMMFQYDNHYSNFTSNGYVDLNNKEPERESIAEYVVELSDLQERIDYLKWDRKWFFIYRNITNTTNERTIIAAITPLLAPVFSCRVLFSKRTAPEISLLLGQFNSLVLDYIARQKLGGTNLSDYFTKQFPVLTPQDFNGNDFIIIVPKVIELTYTSWDNKPFADDVWKEADEDLRAAITQQWEANKAITGGHTWAPPEWCDDYGTSPEMIEGCPLPPFKWDEERRAVLKAELDAIYAKLYGLTTEELRYILDPQDVYGPDFPGETFRVLKEKEIKLYGEYRTRRLVLEAWERLNN